MTAGTEGFTYYGGNRDFLGDLVSKVLAARELAKSERNIAEQVAEQNQTSLEEAGISKGFFFKKALQHEFGGNYITDKKESVKNLFSKRKLLGEILTGKKSGKKISKTERVDAIFDLFKEGNKKSKVDRFLSQYKDIKGRYKAEIDDPMLRPQSPLVPNRGKKIKSATAGSGKRISKEQLFIALTSIVESLNKTAESLGKTTSDVSAGVIRSANSISEMADQIKIRSTTIEDKLDALISAINNQTQVQKQSADKAKDVIREKKVENIRDVSGTEAFDDLTTPQDESQNVQPTTQITNIQNVIPGATSAQRIEQQQMDAYNSQIPQAEQGGVFSGPDSGYNVRLHGNEVVIPLDNNYTQGQPSAVDGVKRQKPRYERGTPGVTNNYSSVGGRFGFGITSMTGIAKGGTTQSSALAQPLVDAMSLSMMATGGSILAATSNYINRIGGEDVGKIRPDIDRITRPIADVFGVPASIVSKTKTKKTAGTTKDKEEDKDKQSKSNIIAKMSEGFAKFLEQMGEKIKNQNNNPPPPPTTGPVDYSNLKSGDISTMAGKAATLYDEFRNIGYTDEGSKRLIAEIGREGGMQNKNLFGTHTDPAAGIANTGMISWNDTRRDKLIAAAKQAGVWDESKGQFKETAEALRFQARFVANEIPTYKGALDKALRTEGSDPSKISQMLRDDYIVYRADSQYSGGKDAQYGSGKTKEWYERLTPGLEQTYKPQTQTPTTASLGQKITENFGMQTHDKFYFKLGGVEYHAYKTTRGFDFYAGGRKVTDPAEEKRVVEGFINLKRNAALNSPDGRTASISGVDSKNSNLNNMINKPSSFDTASAIRPVSSDSAAENLTAFVAMPEVTPKNASTTSLPNAEDATIGQGIPDRGIRNAFLSTPVA
jgi:hypothetical protein